MRKSKAGIRAAEARERAAHEVLARVDLSPSSTPAVLAATLRTLVADASDLAVLVELDVAASDADAVRVRVGEHARAVHGLEDRAEAAEAATGVAAGRIVALEVELQTLVRTEAAARADAESANLEGRRGQVTLEAARTESGAIATALALALAEKAELQAALGRAEASIASARAEVAELRRVLSTVHTESVQAMAAQQAHLAALHTKETRAVQRRADDARRLATRVARARVDELQEQVLALRQASHSAPALVIARR